MLRSSIKESSGVIASSCRTTTLVKRCLRVISSSCRSFGTAPPPSPTTNPFDKTAKKELDNLGTYYDLNVLGDDKVAKLPFSIRVLLESSLRNCDGLGIKESDVHNILDWRTSSAEKKEIPFMPARVLLQDFTGVPGLVDLAAMRDAVKRCGGDPSRVNPLVPVDLVVDHSVQVDYSRSPAALERNQRKEHTRNSERFAFLKWGATAFDGLTIIPPGGGIVHQVNLEYLARVVFKRKGVLYPDSLVGTDSHTTMIDGLGIVGWGVGGIEAEAVMLGQPISMLLPEVIGFELTGKLPEHATATDLVLSVTQTLRKRGVVGKFVEFFGKGCETLTIADRATLSNMSPEYGATMGFFPVDKQTLRYLSQTGRKADDIAMVEKYLQTQKMFRTADCPTPEYTDTLTLDLSSVLPCIAGPKRPHDKVALTDVPAEFKASLTAPLGFKGYELPKDRVDDSAAFKFHGNSYTIKQGSVVIAAITSCTNTSNPAVMLGAGLLARNAVKKGLRVAPYIKTSLSPGSKAVTEYLRASNLDKPLEELGFFHAGYGCMTCIGNSGELDEEVTKALQTKDLVVSAVLSGNRNFEGRVHPLTRANYLASPPLVVAYALAGRIDIDFEKEPLGVSSTTGEDIFLRDIWPPLHEVRTIEEEVVKGEMFIKVYKNITKGTDDWNSLQVEKSVLYPWNDDSSYIRNPPFFDNFSLDLPAISDLNNAVCLLNVGQSITTDHISPAGTIAKASPAAQYLTEKGVAQTDFNTYGARRGNYEVMERGTFANIRLINKICPKDGPKTIHFPTQETLPISTVAERYRSEGTPMIVIAGSEYGSGSSRDWAAKGPLLQGIRAIIAESFERIHRTNLVGMGVLPLQFLDGQNGDSLGIEGSETFSIEMKNGEFTPGEILEVRMSTGATFGVRCRIDTDVEALYFKHGGILPYVLREKIIKGGEESSQQQ